MRFRFLTPNKVSIHAPVWVRLGRRSYSASGILFQFTHPCGCDIPSPLKRYATLRFNSRTRVGATFCQAYGLPLYEVSIHAPVWVRLQRYAKPGRSDWFQFTHPCGCDPRPRDIVNFWISFNSRTRVGATSKPKPSTDKQHVSIHAPVWVRPRNPFVCRLIFRVSIHAPVWVRRQKRIVTGRDMEFQFTHPCGCDSVGMRGIVNPKVSIHAPVWVRLYKTYQQ